MSMALVFGTIAPLVTMIFAWLVLSWQWLKIWSLKIMTHEHPLMLFNSSKFDKVSCSVCKLFDSKNQWIYCCTAPNCDYKIDMHCINATTIAEECPRAEELRKHTHKNQPRKKNQEIRPSVHKHPQSILYHNLKTNCECFSFRLKPVFKLKHKWSVIWGRFLPT